MSRTFASYKLVQEFQPETHPMQACLPGRTSKVKHNLAYSCVHWRRLGRALLKSRSAGDDFEHFTELAQEPVRVSGSRLCRPCFVLVMPVVTPRPIAPPRRASRTLLCAARFRLVRNRVPADVVAPIDDPRIDAKRGGQAVNARGYPWPGRRWHRLTLCSVRMDTQNSVI
jgi:hypothetical protein